MWLASRYGVTNGESVFDVPGQSFWNKDEFTEYITLLEQAVGSGFVQTLKERIDLKANKRYQARERHIIDHA